jgi:AraC-like DNA-binding protein
VLHLLPIFVIIGFYFPFFKLNIEDKMDVLINLKLNDYVFNLEYNVWLILIVMIFYVFLSFNLLKKNMLSLNKKRWLYWLLGSFSAYVFILGTYFLLTYFRLIATEHDYIITYTLIFFIALVTYFGFVQPDVFNGLSMDKVLHFTKYKKTGLTDKHSFLLKKELEDLMLTDKPYLNSELRLNDLAEALNLSRHHTSQIINEHFDATFFDFINTYRIEEAKKLFYHKSDLNITEIIYKAGFNNRTSFYKAFKKHTGLTPKMFKQQLKD